MLNHFAKDPTAPLWEDLDKPTDVPTTAISLRGWSNAQKATADVATIAMESAFAQLVRRGAGKKGPGRLPQELLAKIASSGVSVDRGTVVVSRGGDDVDVSVSITQ